MPDRLDVDDLFGEDTAPAPQPVNPGPSVQPVSVQQPAPVVVQQPVRQQTSFTTFFAFALAAFFAALWITSHRGCTPLPIDDDTIVDVRVPNPTVLIAWDDDGNATDGQKDVLNTTKVQTWCEEHGVTYRRFDVDADLSKAEPYWEVLMKAAADPPSITIALPSGRAKTMTLPDTVDGTINKINSEVN